LIEEIGNFTANVVGSLVEVWHSGQFAVADLLGVVVVLDVAVAAGTTAARSEVVQTEWHSGEPPSKEDPPEPVPLAGFPISLVNRSRKPTVYPFSSFWKSENRTTVSMTRE